MAPLKLSPGRLGRRYGEVGVAGARVNRASYAAGSTTPAHVHPHGDLCVPLRGRYEERWGERVRSVGVGRVVVKPPGLEHVDRFGPRDVVCLNVDFTPEAWERMVGAGFDRPRVGRDPRFVRMAYELEGGLVERERASAVEAEELLLALVGAVVDAGALEGSLHGPERWLETVRERLHADYRSQLRLAELAAEVGVHPAHLSRRFRRRFGRSVGAYIGELRVAAALQGLAEGGRSLAEVAADAGFSDQSHMGRVLRRETGRTPGAWRRRMDGVRGPG